MRTRRFSSLLHIALFTPVLLLAILSSLVAVADTVQATDTAQISDRTEGTSNLSDIEKLGKESLAEKKMKQEFMTMVSLGAALLVALVIILFFSVAFRDGAVRRQIFSAEAGIQFITLFSLIIAMILFGVSGILEGRELSALLGGISGYILGRTNSSRSNAQSIMSSPKITDVSPKTATVGAGSITVPLQISGIDLQLANSIKIAQGLKEILVSNITSNNLSISCMLTLDPNLPKGNYNLTVANSDGGVAKLPNAFTVQ